MRELAIFLIDMFWICCKVGTMNLDKLNPNNFWWRL